MFDRIYLGLCGVIVGVELVLLAHMVREQIDEYQRAKLRCVYLGINSEGVRESNCWFDFLDLEWDSVK
jgi:hypothetical protein